MSNGSRFALVATAIALLTACASYGPGPLAPGDSIQAATARMGQPTATYPSPGGGSRLEFARGPMGLQTFMLDFDAQGLLKNVDQVLDERHFDPIHAGLTRANVLFAIGRPTKVWRVRYHDQTVWSYRYDNPMCRMFQVGFLPDGTIDDTSYGPDPRCERKDDDRVP